MPKTRKSYHALRRKQSKKRAPCTFRNKSKRHTRSKRRHTRSKRRMMRGGRSDEPTDKTVEGIPVTKLAVVSIPGKGIYDLKAFEQHEKDMDFQGEEQEQ